MKSGIFVTGTGTDVGKTFVTALLVKKMAEEGMNVSYYKAAVSGNERDESGKLIPGDAKHVKDVSGISQSLSSMCPYVYENAVSPHLASRIEGNPARKDVIKSGFEDLKSKYDYVVMEGSGGILCPICFDEEEIWLEDIIKLVNLPCIIVADAGLGTINSVVLTVEYMRQKNIPVKGIIFNNYHADSIMEIDNVKMCEHMTNLPTLACVEPGATEIADSKFLHEIF